MTGSHRHIETLICKAAQATDAGDAMRYAQAALNAANAIIGLESLTPHK